MSSLGGVVVCAAAGVDDGACGGDGAMVWSVVLLGS